MGWSHSLESISTTHSESIKWTTGLFDDSHRVLEHDPSSFPIFSPHRRRINDYCVQETPCVFVPSNSLEFLECTASALVSHEPSLLTILVPRLLDMGSVTLLYSLADAWQLVS